MNAVVHSYIYEKNQKLFYGLRGVEKKKARVDILFINGSFVAEFINGKLVYFLTSDSELDNEGYIKTEFIEISGGLINSYHLIKHVCKCKYSDEWYKLMRVLRRE